jgi:hypothetical protein
MGKMVDVLQGNQRRHNTDFDLHGLVSVRLLDATCGDVAAVARQLGPMQANLQRQPDIRIRFVDRQPAGDMRYLGIDDAGFDDRDFWVLRAKHKTPARVRIPFEQIGGACEIVCESGLTSVPLLVPMVNLTALRKGIVPLHAAAFVYNGMGVLATGWSKGGKTETLLAAMARGADYVGDEWVWLGGQPPGVFGLPEPIRLWDWHLHELPEYRAVVGWRQRSRLGAIRLVQTVHGATSRTGDSSPARLLNRVMPALRRQLHVDVAPHKLFGPERTRLQGPLDRVLLLLSHESTQLVVRPIDPDEVARRVAWSVQYERQDLMGWYHRYRFAFPNRANEFLEAAAAAQLTGLQRVLAGKPCFAVFHPYPVRLSRLFDVIEPLVT